MNGRFFRFIGIISLAALCVLAGACQSDSRKPEDEGVIAEQAPATPVEQTVVKPAVAEPAVADTTGPAQDGTGAAAADETEPDAAGADRSKGVDADAVENGPEDIYTGPDLTECEAVDDEFFADAAFMGNSLVDGLHRYGGLGEGSFFAATSASVVNVDTTRNCWMESGAKATLMAALTEKQYAKIYILLGINEIGFETDYFSQLYGAMLDRIIEAEPDADIYIMSLSPITEERSGYRDVFNMERVEIYNQALYALAQEKECYYVDLCQALAGEDGFLPEEESTDGIHLKPEKYPQWADYLRTHVKQ